uniref:J domain-containing protein n=1 Tax=Oryza glumipatula TaxID=40148 RepID=A0A0E0BVS2_9ORYZ
MAATLLYALHKQLEAADKCFSEGNIKGGKMHADMAAALFSSAPEAQCAQAAFKVHAAAAAAATKDKTKTDHYAVLGVKLSATGKPDATTTDAVRKQHKALCAMFATAKDTSAAVAAANKLVDEALSALTDIKKSDVMSPPPTSTSTYSYQQKQQVARRKAKQRQEDQEFQARAACYQEEEEDDYYGGGRDKDGGRGGRHRGR